MAENKPRWRVGSKIPVNLYKDDAIAGQCQRPELAAEIVNGMNAGLEFRNTVAMLNAAIRIVRQLGGPEADVLLWAEQVKSGMALVSGAPDYAHALFVVDLEQRNKELYEALELVLRSAVPHPTEHPTMTAAWAVARAALAKAKGGTHG